MTRSSIALFLLCLISATPALARIGDTPEQCEARYGKPTREKAGEYGRIFWFQKAGYEVMCIFFEGRCDRVDFSKLEKSANGRSLPLTAAEVKVLLETNTAGKPWVQGVGNPQKGYTTWECGDLQAFSKESEKDCFLTIATRMHDLRIKPDPEREARKRLEGF